MAYATPDDVYTLALPAQAFVAVPRPVNAASDVDIATATIRLQANGLSTDDVITFVPTSGGTLPTGISAFTAYYPLPVTSDLFRVSLTKNGPPIASWASAGRGWSVAVDQLRRLRANLESTAAQIDECLTAQLPPILPDPTTGKLPQIVVALNARMAALATVISLQVENAQYRTAIDVLQQQREWDGYGAKGAIAGTLLGDWKLGKPIQPRPTDSNNVPDNAAIAASATPMPWRSQSIWP